MSVLEQDFMKCLMIALGSRPDMRIHRQNSGSVEVVKKGKIVGVFHAGPPAGCADISGIVKPEGYRLEVETKSETAKNRDAQFAWQEMITSMGGIYIRVRYNEDLTMEENISDTVTKIEQAIAERRSKK